MIIIVPSFRRIRGICCKNPELIRVNNRQFKCECCFKVSSPWLIYSDEFAIPKHREVPPSISGNRIQLRECEE